MPSLPGIERPASSRTAGRRWDWTVPRTGLLLSPGYSLPPWPRLNPSVLQTQLIWDSGMSLFPTPWLLNTRPPSGYYDCRGRCPLTPFPWNVGPYLVECRHLLCHPRVAVLVDGVEGQAAQHRTGQYRPEAQQVDVEGPAPTCTETPCSKSHKTLLGPSEQVPAPAPRRPPGLWLSAGKGVTIRLPAFHPVWGQVFKYMNYTSCFGGTVWVPVPWQSLLGRWWEWYGNPQVSSCVWVLRCKQLARRRSSPLATLLGKDKSWTDL